MVRGRQIERRIERMQTAQALPAKAGARKPDGAKDRADLSCLAAAMGVCPPIGIDRGQADDCSAAFVQMAL